MFNEKKKIRNAFTKYCGDNSSWEISDDGEHSYISISDKVNYPRPKGRELVRLPQFP